MNMALDFSSCSILPSSYTYDVFISFRGEDTRKNFTSHLYEALCRKKIKTYMDEESLERGAEISPALLKAIRESKLSLIIFSQNYAESTWCLDELVHVLKRKTENGQIVIPIFHGVDPSHVRKQEGSYAQAFVAHEQRFKDNMEKVHEWKAALKVAGSLSGWDSQDRYESKLIEMIIDNVLRKLNRIPSSILKEFNNGLVGMEKQLKKIESVLCFGSLSTRIVGIWGMGGIGKTTLAYAVFDRFSHQFEGCCFLANVREESNKHGLIHLKAKLFSELLEEGILSVASCFVRDRLRRKKMLIVFDDINNTEQLECLAGDHNWFGGGSKIIVTTRDVQLLRKKADEIYEMEALDFDEALNLFYFYAYERNPSFGARYRRLSKEIVNYSAGNPLALKVLGSFLHSRTVEEWESALDKLKRIPHADIQKVLRISYDGLDDEEKNIFLDIVCFYKGEDKDFIKRRLDGCFPSIGIRVLIDKSLITIEGKRVGMHDLVQEMGWEIVRQQSPRELGKRSRLWIAQEVYHVLKYNKGTDSIEGIHLDMSKIDEELHLKPKVFQEMCNLRLLKIHNGSPYYHDSCKLHLSKGLRCLPHSLRFLNWYKYPLKSMPSKFEPRNLVEFVMPHSKLKRLWDGVQNLGNIRHLDLSYSKQLIKVPDLSLALKLESINLAECTSLLDVPSLNFQKSLRYLNLGGCTYIRTVPGLHGNIDYLDLRAAAIEVLPSAVESAESLRFLYLSHCQCLKNFPKLPMNIVELSLGGTSIEEVPSSIGFLNHLEYLGLNGCKRLERIQVNICRLKSLVILDLTDCSRLENLSETVSLEGIGIQELSSSTENTSGLHSLYLSGCENLKSLPNFLYQLNYRLDTLYLRGCLKLEHCRTNLPLFSLTYLDLSYCNILQIPDWFCLLHSLKVLFLEGNSFDRIPPSITQLYCLNSLCVNDCTHLRSLPELPFSLRDLYASGCTSLETLSNLNNAKQLVAEYTGPDFDVNCFNFFNCLKLDHNALHNLNDFCYAITRVERQHFHRTQVCYPGNEIPKWFTHQSEESSRTIKLSTNWFNNNIYGFAACFVASVEGCFGSPNNQPYLCFNSSLQLKTIYGESLGEFRFQSTWGLELEKFIDDDLERGSKFASSNHVFITCGDYASSDTSKNIRFSDAAELLFNFNALSKSDNTHLKVKRCGVRMLYRQQTRNLMQVTRQYYLRNL